jgi:hypothetical protein
MFTRKSRLQLEKFAINGAKRLLQHNRHSRDRQPCRPRVRLVRRCGREMLSANSSVDIGGSEFPQRTLRHSPPISLNALSCFDGQN